MKDQPKTEQLVRKFYWCQWDVLHQRLYYIHYKKQLVDDQAKVQAILSSMQFYNKAQYDSIVRSLYSVFYKHFYMQKYCYTTFKNEFSILENTCTFILYFYSEIFFQVSFFTQNNEIMNSALKFV